MYGLRFHGDEYSYGFLQIPGKSYDSTAINDIRIILGDRNAKVDKAVTHRRTMGEHTPSQMRYPMTVIDLVMNKA